MKTKRERALMFLGAALVLILGQILPGCGGGGGGAETIGAGPFSSGGGGSGVASKTVSGSVLNKAGIAIGGATVYLVPATQINTTQITATAVTNGTAEAYDEPIEDLVVASGVSFTQAVTSSNGSFSMSAPSSGNYFVYVKPADTDIEHLPGGSYSRFASSTTVLSASSLTIRVSSKPSAAAQYIGTSGCLNCHSDKATVKYAAHSLSISVPNTNSTLQNRTLYPSSNNALAFFTPANAYTDPGVTVLELGDYNGTRVFDKFKVRVAGDTRLSITTIYAKFYLWKDNADNIYKITVTNQLNGGDVNSPLTLPVKLTYGGPLGKMHFLVQPPASLTGGVQRKGLYVLLQYNVQGNDTRFNPTKRVWRDYNFGDWWNPGVDATYGNTDDKLQASPPTKTFQGNCAACHFIGYSWSLDSVTGEHLAGAVNDANGEYDIDNDGFKDNVNIGCEICHGPGSEHRSVAQARYIVVPRLLSPERENQICGRCHDRPKGQGTLVNQQPLNTANKVMRPGESRATFLANYCSPTQKGPAADNMWDEVFSNINRQQYSDFIKSKHYKNNSWLLVCSDCHDIHGGSGFAHQLKYDPATPAASGGLCNRCHNLNISTHMTEKSGSTMGGLMDCTACHMAKTPFGASGNEGYTRANPPYADSTGETNNVYWVGDRSSHSFYIPHKTDAQVAGKAPGNAMPIPYTNGCGQAGACHNAQSLKPEQ